MTHYKFYIVLYCIVYVIVGEWNWKCCLGKFDCRRRSRVNDTLPVHWCYDQHSSTAVVNGQLCSTYQVSGLWHRRRSALLIICSLTIVWMSTAPNQCNYTAVQNQMLAMLLYHSLKTQQVQ